MRAIALAGVMAAGALAAAGVAFAQPQTGPRPDRSGPGPWDQDVQVFRVAAGRQELLATFGRAGVPTVARLRDGRLIAAFQHFPQDDDRHFDRVAVRLSSDEGRSWTPAQPIVVDGMEPGLARPFDPTLVPLPDGRVRLYFTSSRSADFRRGEPAIHSAISSDGVRYAFEPGARFAVPGRIVIDCAVALHEGLFHLVVPDNGDTQAFHAAERGGGPPPGEGRAYYATSRDGLSFSREADLVLPVRGRWLGNLVSDGASLAFFGTGPGPWPVTSRDGRQWMASAEGARIPGGDPGAVRLRDGAWLVLATSPPRPGTPSAQRQKPAPRRD